MMTQATYWNQNEVDKAARRLIREARRLIREARRRAPVGIVFGQCLDQYTADEHTQQTIRAAAKRILDSE